MGLKNWLNKIFFTEHYNCVEQAYRSAKAKCRRGFDLFIDMQDEYSFDDPDNFDLKEYVYNNYSFILELDRKIIRLDYITTEYKDGYEILLKELNISKKSLYRKEKYEFLRKIIDSEERIVKIENIIQEYKSLIENMPYGIILYMNSIAYKIPSFLQRRYISKESLERYFLWGEIPFEEKEILVNNKSLVSKYNNKYIEYELVKKSNPKGYNNFCIEYMLNETMSIDFIDRILLGKDIICVFEKIIPESDLIIKNYQDAVTRFLESKKIHNIDFNNIKLRKLIVDNKTAIIESHKICDNYNNLRRKFPKGVNIYNTINCIKASNISDKEKEEACQAKSAIINYQAFHDKFNSLLPFIKHMFNTNYLFNDIISYIKEKGDNVIPELNIVLSRFIELIHYREIIDLYIGRNINTQSIINAVSNFDMLRISGEFINNRVGVSSTMLDLFDLTLNDVKTIDNSKIKEKEQFLEYKKIKVEKNSKPLFRMTNTATPIVHPILNAANPSLDFENTNANSLDFCNAVKTLYGNKWTIQKALDYIEENKDRIFLYCRHNNLKQVLNVSTLDAIVRDYKLVNFLKLTDAEIEEKEAELRQAIAKVKEIVKAYPKTIQHYVNNGQLKKYTNNMTLSDCLIYINNEQHFQLTEFQLISKEEEYRQTQKNRIKAASIKRSYPKGYDYYVSVRKISELTVDLPLQELIQIVALEKSIISKHQEIEQQEIEVKRRAEEAARVDKAKKLASQYPKAYKALFPHLSSYNIISSDCNQILDRESELRSLDSFFSSVSNWEEIRKIPYFHFYHYYPSRFSNISSESKHVRDIIYKFKDGKDHSEVLDMMTSKLKTTFYSSELRELTLVCVPASTRSDNDKRFKSFSEDLCMKTGMSNGFDHIKITREKTPSHLGGCDKAEYSADSWWFSGKKVVLFDDVVTRGRSMDEFKELLHNVGATVICAMSIGRTYSDYHGDNRTPHPWTGNL